MLPKSLLAVGVAAAIAAPAPQSQGAVHCAQPVRAPVGIAQAKKVWRLDRWRRGKPKPAAIRAHRRHLRCAAGPGHREAMKRAWGRDRERYFAHRRERLEALSIDHRWTPHWAPDWSGPRLPPWLIAALAEEAGDAVGVDVPGWTMEQVTRGESIGRPGSAAVDVGGTYGVGLWAITWPFADPILARYGWTYEDMFNPARNSIVMAEIYGRQGIGAWYGTRYVTDWDRHYRGRFDLRLVLGGKTLRQVVRGFG